MFTEIEIVPVRPRNGLVAYCSAVYNNSLYMGNIALIKRKDGSYKLGYPSKKVGEDYIPICNPINRETHDQLLEAITNKAEVVFNN
jgi:stage V sporulation protein G